MYGTTDVRRFNKRGVLAAVGILIVASGLAVWAEVPVRQSLGVTFSTSYARDLGLDTRETFTALLDDVGVRQFRIPVYWSDVEPREGVFHWDDVDWMMGEAEKRGARVTLAIGKKVPRWPECFVPDWAETGDDLSRTAQLETFLTTVVERYRNSPALVRWQVENEPAFSFGVCPRPDMEEWRHEVSVVRLLDGAHPIVSTASGELEPWYPVAGPADVIGISMYRVTWNKLFGYFRYPIPAWVYRVRSVAARPFVDATIISELQAEPWFPEPIANRTPAEWSATFTPRDLAENVSFAARTGISETNLWGAEWWFWLKKHGDSGLWDEAKRIFSER